MQFVKVNDSDIYLLSAKELIKTISVVDLIMKVKKGG